MLVLSIVSPLLTMLRLWQLKEWRIDRLREHLQAEGLGLLWGKVRPAIVVLWLIAVFLLPLDAFLESIALPAVLLCLGMYQAIRGLQHRPVWTMKALTLTLTSLIIALLVALPIGWMTYSTQTLIAEAIFVLCAPFIVALSWCLWLPVDAILKKRILRKARAMREKIPLLTVIAICGSVGKTTTKELLKNALISRFPVATPAYVNSELGVAKWFMQEVKSGAIHSGGIVIVEMGGYRKGEVTVLCDMMQPTIGIVTAVGTQHIALYGSMEQILESEREMPRSLPKEGLLLLNGDIPECEALQSVARCTVVTVGSRPNDDLRAENIVENDSGLTFTADEEQFSVPLHGKHNVQNILLAYGAAKAACLAPSDIIGSLQRPVSLSHTFRVYTHHEVLVLDDTHNSSPQSLAAGIAWAKEQSKQPKVLCTMGLIEQGSFEDSEMETFGKNARGVFDRVIFVGPRGRSAFERGYGKKTEQPGSAAGVRQGLLVCLGRVAPSLIEHLLS